MRMFRRGSLQWRLGKHSLTTPTTSRLRVSALADDLMFMIHLSSSQVHMALAVEDQRLNSEGCTNVAEIDDRPSPG